MNLLQLPKLADCVCGGIGFISDNFAKYGWGHTFSGECSKCRRNTGAMLTRRAAADAWNEKQAKAARRKKTSAIILQLAAAEARNEKPTKAARRKKP